MNRFHITLACLILSIFQVFLSPVALANTTKAVGTLPGAFSVGGDGTANYRVPLELPPGINGLTPSLALEYGSRKGNGLVGMGWRLTGFPAINRCATTLAQDGFIDGVDFDDNDKFCFKGQRLVAINGNYGANGTEYRTEQENDLKIISYGTAGNGPAYFKIWYKNGMIETFGETDDARFEAQGTSEVIGWSINKTEDRLGNLIHYFYTENHDDGEHFPQKITYANTTLNFNYDENGYSVTSYLNGSRIIRRRHLTKVAIQAGSTTQHYQLRYDHSVNDRQHWLKGLTRCTTEEVCLPETQFNWEHAEAKVTPYRNISLATPGLERDQSQYRWLTGDVNGDGATDLIAARLTKTGNVATVRLGVPGDPEEGISEPQVWHQDGQNWKNYHHFARDVNGDGLTDLVASHLSSSSGNVVYVQLSTGSSFTAPQKWTHIATGWQGYQSLMADLNGDGRSDMVYYALTAGMIDIEVQLSTGDGFAPLQKWFYRGNNWSGHTMHVGDMNGDGKQDLVITYIGAAGNQVYVIRSTDKDRQLEHWQRNFEGWADGQHLIGDMNGDGNDDVVSSYLGVYGNLISVSLSTGNGLLPMAKWYDVRTGYLGSKRQLADLNGDGKQDLVTDYFGKKSHYTWVHLSQGDGLQPVATWNGVYSDWDKWQRILGDYNGDGQVDLAAGLLSKRGNFVNYQYIKGSLTHRITEIRNGLGQTTTLRYQPLTDPTLFTKSTGSTYPIIDRQSAVFVVQEVKQDNGLGGSLTTQYHYKGLKHHLRGLGALGFAEISSTQLETGIKTTDHYLQDTEARKIGVLSRSQQWSADGVLLKDSQQTWQVTTLDDGDLARYRVQLKNRTTQQKSLQDAWLSTVTESFSYDDWGNATESKQVIKDALGEQQSTTVTTYQNDETNWLLGLATQTQVTSVSVAGDSQTRTMQFRYDPTTGALTQRVQEPGQGDYVLTTDFKYDSFGNLIEEQTQGAKVAVRKQTYTYDAQGQFLTSTTNALGHQTQQTSDPFWGVPLTTTDANGLVTTYTYDALGRLKSQTAPDNTQTTITHGWCAAATDNTCPTRAVYWSKTQRSGSAPSTVYLDKLERTLRTETLALTGKTQYQDTVYNALGQVEKTSLPYFKDAEVYWTQYEYDPLLRVIKTTQPNGSTTEVAYQGLNKVLTNAKGQTKTEHYNGAGQLVKVIDSLGNTLSYTYDSFGNLTQTTDPDNNTVDLTYDVLGRKVAMNDPDKGAWTYEYDALGRLIRQQDAKGQVTKLSYDNLDRLVKQTENAQASSKLLWRVSEWQYDQQRKGQLDQVTVDGISQQYQYDTLGRLTAETQTLFGESFTLNYGYDEYSRPLQTTFPTGLIAKQTYNEHGYLTAITDGQDSNATTYWQAQAADALGNITQQQYGNGATTLRVFDAKTGRLQDSGAYISSTTQIEDLHFAYDELGNLTQREDKRQKIQETFAYDQLNRLTEVTAKLSSNTLTTSVQYDALGNITHKSDVGDYQYADKCGSQQAGPHALTKTSGSQNATYCYDANGNMTSGNGRTVRYTAFDKPDQIIRGDHQIDLVYGPDQKRVRRIDQGPTGTSTTYYQSGIYEKVVSDTGKIQHKHYIADVAIITKTENAGTEEGTKTNYFHRDHLSSITAITDQNGQVVERFSYDPWGKRRQTDWQAAIDFTQITSTITKRGFTNHEHLDGVGLIHMNGRVYDPNVGRFLSADPFIQFASNIQSYNRYSYGFNNPLNGTDPTGFTWEEFTNWLFGSDDNAGGETCSIFDGYNYNQGVTPSTNARSSSLSDFDNGFSRYSSQSNSSSSIISEAFGQEPSYMQRVTAIAGFVSFAAEEMFYQGFIKPMGENFPGGLFGALHRAREDRQMTQEEYMQSIMAAGMPSGGVGVLGKIKTIPKMTPTKMKQLNLGSQIGKVTETAKLAEKVSDAYKCNRMCKEFADDLQKKMKTAGINGQRLDMETGTGLIYSNTNKVISTNGTHSAIKVDDTVFDNLNSKGVNYSDWIEDLGGKEFTNPPHAIIKATDF